MSMAPPKKGEPSDYEQQRQQNIQRNQQMIASVLRHKSQLALLLAPPTPKPKPKRRQNPNPPPLPLRRSLRSRGLPPPHSPSTSPSTPTPTLSPPSPHVPTGRFSFQDALLHTTTASYRPLLNQTSCLGLGEGTEMGNALRQVPLGSALDARVGLGLKEQNVRKVVTERIMILNFLPLPNRSILVSGNRQGYLAIWDADLCAPDGPDGADGDGVFLFFPHRSPVSGIAVHPSSLTKIYSSCYDGDLCLMDMEKEMFDIIHSSDYTIYSLSQSPHDHNSLFLGEWGQVKSFDERAGKVVKGWTIHEQRVNTIDFHPVNSNLFATSSSNGLVQLWDLRCIDKDRPKSIKELAHNRAAYSAYFSPTGNSIVSTSADDSVRILSGAQYEDLSIIKHNNQTGRWLSTFRAIWGWNDSYIFIGNMRRAVDVISTEDNITTSLQSEHMTNIPCRFATHPFKEGHLACAGGGKLYLWTKL